MGRGARASGNDKASATSILYGEHSRSFAAASSPSELSEPLSTKLFTVYLIDPYGSGSLTGPLSEDEAKESKAHLEAKWPDHKYELREA